MDRQFLIVRAETHGGVLQGRHFRQLAPRRVAALCIVGFSAALTLLWGITFTAQMHSLP